MTARGLERWALGHACMMLAAVGGSVAINSAWPLTLAGPAGLLALVWLERGALASRGGFGWANGVTSVRVVLCALLPHVGVVPHAAALLALVVFTLDRVDGWLAQRLGQTTSFGARYDMEADAFFVASASVAAFQFGRLGAFVLSMGVLRYAYVVLLAVLRRSDADAPRTRLGRYVFGVVAVSLCAALWPLEPVHRPLALAASMLLGYSFARSLAWSISSSTSST